MRLPRAALTLLVTLSLAAPLSAAHAHPRLLKATPAADSRSTEAPQQVALTFNEALDIALTRVTLLRGDAPVRVDSLRVAAGDEKTIVASLGAPLAPGRYTVRWQVTGSDGHPVRGTYSFEILASDGGSADGTSSRALR
jgi:copper resistance protein C